MRLLLHHHPDEAAFAARLAAELAPRGLDLVATPAEADLVLLLASRAALRDGLGRAPREAVEAGLAVLTLLVGDDALPSRFPVHRKHTPLANDVAAVLKRLTEHQAHGDAQQIDSKREVFGHGLLLALLHRAP